MSLVTYAQFIIDFPEFATLDEPSFNSIYKRSLLVGSEFTGIEPESDRATVQGLFLAHLLELRDQKLAGHSAAIKSVKSRNDSITYAVSDSPDELERTSYGQLICYYLANNYKGGFLV